MCHSIAYIFRLKLKRCDFAKFSISFAKYGHMKMIRIASPVPVPVPYAFANTAPVRHGKTRARARSRALHVRESNNNYCDFTFSNTLNEMTMGQSHVGTTTIDRRGICGWSNDKIRILKTKQRTKTISRCEREWKQNTFFSIFEFDVRVRESRKCTVELSWVQRIRDWHMISNGTNGKTRCCIKNRFICFAGWGGVRA